MSADRSAFSDWALNEARTGDERFLIYLLCEACRFLEHLRRPEEERRGVSYKSTPYGMWKEYYLNPLLLPEYGVEDTERAARMAPWLVKFEPPATHDMRRIGDAGAALRFFPALEVLSLGWCAVRDLGFVAELPRLRSLLLYSGVAEDLSPLARCTSLRELSLQFSGVGAPLFTPPLYWLDARPLGALRGLEKLTLGPNAAVLAGLVFPALRTADFSGSTCIQPDCTHLPDMPALRVLRLGGVQSLRGISRFTELRHLHVSGPLRDFGDIAALRKLSCLEVDTMEGWPRDVSPLSELPELLWARFGGEIPRNYWPMARAPRLCELVVHQAPAVALEVQAVNAVLPSWDTIFEQPELRARPPLRFVAVEFGADRRLLPQHLDAPGPDYLAHPKLFHLELCWMQRRALAAARKAAGEDRAVDDGIYSASENTWERHLSFELNTMAAVRHFPAVIEALREAMAASPHDWTFRLWVRLRLTEMEMTEQQKKWLRQIGEYRRDDEDDMDERVERYRKTQQHLIETQFHLRTSQEEGEEPDPEDYVPPEEIRPETQRRGALTPAGGKGGDEEEEDNPDYQLKPFDEQEQNSDDDDDDDEDVAVAQDPEPPPEFWDDPYAHPLQKSYMCFFTLTFDTIYHEGNNLATAQQLVGREPDVFHAAPAKE